MAGRETHTDAERAKVYVSLQANNGMVKRAARETGIAETTVRRWKKEFETTPPEGEMLELAKKLADDFAAQAEEVRDLALAEIKRKITAGEAKLGELITTVGVLDDKVTRARGMATGKIVHEHQLPSREDLTAALQPAIADAMALASQRQEEIVDAEVVEDAEQRALPAAQ